MKYTVTTKNGNYEFDTNEYQLIDFGYSVEFRSRTKFYVFHKLDITITKSNI